MMIIHSCFHLFPKSTIKEDEATMAEDQASIADSDGSWVRIPLGVQEDANSSSCLVASSSGNTDPIFQEHLG